MILPFLENRLLTRVRVELLKQCLPRSRSCPNRIQRPSTAIKAHRLALPYPRYSCRCRGYELLTSCGSLSSCVAALGLCFEIRTVVPLMVGRTRCIRCACACVHVCTVGICVCVCARRYTCVSECVVHVHVCACRYTRACVYVLYMSVCACVRTHLA